MTRIILHTGIPPQQEMRLELPWMWWETRIYPNVDGILYEQRIDPDLFEHPRRSEYMVTFGRDGDTMVLTDPPALRLTSIESYSSRYGGVYGDERFLHTHVGPRYLTVRVVWHEPPGQIQVNGNLLTHEAWHPCRKPTCVPGDYRFDILDRDDWHDGPDGWCPLSYMPPLQWPITPTICDGEPVAPGGIGGIPPASGLAASWLRWAAPRQDMYSICPPDPPPRPPFPGHPKALTRPAPKTVEPLKTSGKRTIDGINDDDIIKQIDRLIDDELAGGEYAREQRRTTQ